MGMAFLYGECNHEQGLVLLNEYLKQMSDKFFTDNLICESRCTVPNHSPLYL